MQVFPKTFRTVDQGIAMRILKSLFHLPDRENNLFIVQLSLAQRRQ